MKVKNMSARLHWVGDVMCVPGEIAEIDDKYASAINKDELVPVVDDEPADAPAEDKPTKRTRRAK
jgi:hypothetical protein